MHWRSSKLSSASKAIKRDVNIVAEFDDLLQGGEELLYPRERRYAVDNMWTRPPPELIPQMRGIADTLLPAPSHMMWMLWGPTQSLPDMAFSMQDDLYIALYAVGDDQAEDGHTKLGLPSTCAGWSRSLPEYSLLTRTSAHGHSGSFEILTLGGLRRCARNTIRTDCSILTWGCRR